MIFLKNRLIFGTIRRIIKTVFSVVYKIIKAFNLHLTLFVALLGAVLVMLGVINKEGVGVIIYLAVLGLTIVYAVLKTIKKIFGTKPKNGKVKIVKVGDSVGPEQDQTSHEQPQPQQVHQTVQSYQEKPVYYTVKNNPSYVYAEYSDRYELFLKTSSGLKRVRVDLK